MNSLSRQLERVTRDKRVGLVHLSLYVALLQCHEAQGGTGPIFLVRDEVMRLARIQGRSTYYKTLKELDRYGLVRYRPSWNKWRLSRVYLIHH